MIGAEDNTNPNRDQQLELLQQAFADALVRGEEPRAEQTMSEAIELEFDEAQIDEHIVAPAMRLVGDLWAEGELGVADEHLATEISLRVLALQREAFRVARRRSQHRIIFAAVQGEQHVVGLRMAASLALHAGFDVRMLGADVPVHALLQAITRHDPHIIGLTGTMPVSSAWMREAADAVLAAVPAMGIVAGGAAVDHRFELHTGVRVCRHVTDLLGQLEGLVQGAARN